MDGIKIEEKDGEIKVGFNNDEIEYNVNELPLQTLKTIEIAAVQAVSGYLYGCILDSSIVKFLIEGKNNVKTEHFESVADYYENMKKIQKIVNNFTKTADKGAEQETDDFVMALIVNGAKNSYKEVDTFVNISMPIFENFVKVENLCAREISKEDFLKIVSGLNKKLTNNFNVLNKFSQNAEGLLLGDIEVVTALSDSFKKITKNLDPKNLKEDEFDEFLKDLKKVPAGDKSESEIQREFYIARANDLYNQLQFDWMRDLNKQVPFSAKERYNAYMTKFNKFSERFQMPLAEDTSLGMAKEICAQINNLMDYISNISSEAYSISPYSERE